MPDARDPDVVRLSLPADRTLQPVVEVAVAVLARRARIDDDGIAAGRLAAGAAFADVVERAGQGPVDIAIEIAAASLTVTIQAPGAAARLTMPDG